MDCVSYFVAETFAFDRVLYCTEICDAAGHLQPIIEVFVESCGGEEERAQPKTGGRKRKVRNFFNE